MATTGTPKKVILEPGPLRRLGALGALTAAVMFTAPAALGQPSPDPAPVAPTIAPDPAPAAPTAVDDSPATDDQGATQDYRPAPKARRAERRTAEPDRTSPRPVATPA